VRLVQPERDFAQDFGIGPIGVIETRGIDEIDLRAILESTRYDLDGYCAYDYLVHDE